VHFLVNFVEKLLLAAAVNRFAVSIGIMIKVDSAGRRQLKKAVDLCKQKRTS
jgi:hypothetical protein